ncbi:hydrolase [Variovorax paradoxus]|nr:isochorismate family cysteine hydrolase YcaC [Variovorax paradoxus]MBT2300978.1 hydrolase [Variovorax paradoxus]
MTKKPALVRRDDAVVAFLDHQTGLFSLVRDFGPDEFRNNVLALAATAKHFKLPTILATSMETGPNGVILPQLKESFPDAPYIARAGEINAWESPEFVAAVKATGRKQLIFSGIVTDVCVAMPTLDALAEGFEVFVVVDASGTFSPAVREATHKRMVAAGAHLINWFALACELQRDWRNAGEGLATLLSKHLPDYDNLMSTAKSHS